MRRKVFLDGRNVYEPSEMRAHGFEYRGIGRPMPNGKEEDSHIAAEPSAAISAKLPA